jgi:hypothetical protein
MNSGASPAPIRIRVSEYSYETLLKTHFSSTPPKDGLQIGLGPFVGELEVEISK